MLRQCLCVCWRQWSNAVLLLEQHVTIQENVGPFVLEGSSSSAFSSLQDDPDKAGLQEGDLLSPPEKAYFQLFHENSTRHAVL